MTKKFDGRHDDTLGHFEDFMECPDECHFHRLVGNGDYLGLSNTARYLIVARNEAFVVLCKEIKDWNIVDDLVYSVVGQYAHLEVHSVVEQVDLAVGRNLNL